MSAHTYIGQELHLFAQATNWKSYIRTHIDRYLGNDVLEVGAGIGGTTRLLCRRKHRRWVCLEPDPRLAAHLQERLAAEPTPTDCEIVIGTLAGQLQDQQFDSIIYIDVLEHIEADHEEMRLAATRLNPDGFVLVLSPSHQWLYTEFDKAIGHFRRYSRATLAAAVPKGLRLERLIYLDSIGMLASLGNRLLLRKSLPSAPQIALWDGVMVRMSRLLDPILFHSLGKSVLGVWRKV